MAALSSSPSSSSTAATAAPAQDRTATYIVLYMTAAVCLLVPVLLGELRSYASLILWASALLYFNLGGVVAGSTARRLKYLDPAFPRRNALTLLLLGLVQAVHWLTCSHLFYHTHVNLWLLDTALAVCLATYFLYALWRGRSPRFSLHVAAVLLSISMLAVTAATSYKHFTRKLQHTHIRNDWRLLYIGLVQVLHVLLLCFGTRHFQAWFLQALALPLYILVGVCAGHRRLQF